MTEPQDPAVAGGDRLRAGHADREQVIEALKTAYMQGRLTGEELGARTGQVLAARTYAELRAVTADLPRAPRLDGSSAPARAEMPGGQALVAAPHDGVGHDLDPPGRRTDQTRSDLRTRISWPRRSPSSGRGAQAPRGIAAAGIASGG
jgi:Domain of unknown function (DUF1707)